MNENKILIIYSHPWEKSFSHAVLETVKKALDEKKAYYQVIDLNKEKFNPVYTQKELALYQKGKFLDSKVGAYQKKIKNSNFLIFIFPIWWGAMPAIIKGFIDKVFLPGWAYIANDMGLFQGKLKHIRKSLTITTMGSPKIFYNFYLKNPIKQILINDTLKICGIKKNKLIQLGRVAAIQNKKRTAWLEKIKKFINKSAY